MSINGDSKTVNHRDAEVSSNRGGFIATWLDSGVITVLLLLLVLAVFVASPSAILFVTLYTAQIPVDPVQGHSKIT